METREAQRTKHTVIVLVVSLVQMSVAALCLNSLSMEGWSAVYAEDSEGYLLTARFFLGEDIPSPSLPLLQYRLFSPVVPFIASLFARFIPLEYTFLVVNALLWLLASYLCYIFAQTFLNDRCSYYCALLFTTSLPVFVWGLPIMVDMAAFCWALLNCLLITRIASTKKALPFILVLTLSLAILIKPTLGALLIFLLLYGALQKQLLQTVSVVVLTGGLVGLIYLFLGLGFEDFQTYGYLRHQGLFYVANALFFCFHWGIPLAVWGFFGEKEQRVFHSTYLVATFGCYLTFVHNPRLLFIVFPAVLPLVVSGMKRLAQRGAHYGHFKPENIVTVLVCSYMLTSTLLSVVYLYITRVLQYRTIENIKPLLG